METEEARSKVNLRKTFYISLAGFFFIFGGYIILVDLQSSVNIEDGLGSVAMLLAFSCTALSTLFVTPVFVSYFGAKAGLVASDVGICILSAANFYPKWYTLLPAAVVNGATVGALWVSMNTITHSVSTGMLKIKLSEGFDGAGLNEILAGYFAKFYAFRSIARMASSALSYLVLHGVGMTRPDNITNEWKITDEDWSQCLANDCQLDYVYNATKSDLSKYTPVTTSLYILVGVLLFLQLSATMAHIFLLPHIPARFKKAGGERRPSFVEYLKKTLKLSFGHVISIQHLLVFPLAMYTGLLIGYVSSEFSRAYVSCTIGVENVGLCMVCYGISGLVTSSILSHWPDEIRRAHVILTAFALDMTNYAIALLWEPAPASSFVLYILAAMFGASSMLLFNGSANVVGVYFKDHVEIAYSMQTVAINFGILVGFGWSVPLCVGTKIYILIPFFSFAVFCWGASELRFRRLSGQTQRE